MILSFQLMSLKVDLQVVGLQEVLQAVVLPVADLQAVVLPVVDQQVEDLQAVVLPVADLQAVDLQVADLLVEGLQEDAENLLVSELWI